MTLNQAVTHQISQLPEVADTLTQVLSVESASQGSIDFPPGCRGRADHRCTFFHCLPWSHHSRRDCWSQHGCLVMVIGVLHIMDSYAWKSIKMQKCIATSEASTVCTLRIRHLFKGFINNSNVCRACSLLNQHTMHLYAPVVAGFVNVCASLFAWLVCMVHGWHSPHFCGECQLRFDWYSP